MYRSSWRDVIGKLIQLVFVTLAPVMLSPQFNAPNIYSFIFEWEWVYNFIWKYKFFPPKFWDLWVSDFLGAWAKLILHLNVNRKWDMSWRLTACSLKVLHFIFYFFILRDRNKELSRYSHTTILNHLTRFFYLIFQVFSFSYNLYRNIYDL